MPIQVKNNESYKKFRVRKLLNGANQCVCSYATALDDVLTLTVDDYYLLYFDGVLVANRTSSSQWRTQEKFLLPSSTGVIAIAGINLVVNVPPNPAGIIASDSAGQIWTNSSWRCSKLSLDGWMDVGFDDSGWPYAKEEASNGGGIWQSLSDISTNAKWIWTNNFNAATGFLLDVSVYCRVCIGTLDFNYMLAHLSL